MNQLIGEYKQSYQANLAWLSANRPFFSVVLILFVGIAPSSHPSPNQSPAFYRSFTKPVWPERAKVEFPVLPTVKVFRIHGHGMHLAKTFHQ